MSWLGTWLQQDRGWNWRTLTYTQFDQLFARSVSEFSSVIATDNPDLTPFGDHGGKILIWHGLADQLIFPQGRGEVGGAGPGAAVHLATVTDPATGAVTLSRPLCAYPLVARYNGQGRASQVRNFTCAPDFGRH